MGAYLVYSRTVGPACLAAAEGKNGRRIEGEVKEVIGDRIMYSLIGYWKDFTLREVRNYWKVLNI